MNNDQEQDRGEFAPAPTVFNDLTSLKYKQTVGPIESAMRDEAIAAIKEALKQQNDEQWTPDDTAYRPGGLEQPEQEPVIDQSAAVRIATALGWTPQRKPLTDEEIEKMRHLIDWTAAWSYINFARAIEAAYGVKE